MKQFKKMLIDDFNFFKNFNWQKQIKIKKIYDLNANLKIDDDISERIEEY